MVHVLGITWKITPQCPTILFFPQEEQSFNVDELILDLEKMNIEMHKFKGKHGFSDPYSPQYNEKSAEKAFSEMVGKYGGKYE